MPENRSMPLGARCFRIERGAFLKVCESVNTARSLACYLLAKHDEWEQYLDLSFPDTELDSFADDYLVTEAMRKNPNLPNVSFNRLNTAFMKWKEAEDLCSGTNEIFSKYQEGLISFNPAFEALLTKSQGIIADILGELTPEKLRFAESKFRFGPGATSSCSGAYVVPSRKFTSRLDVTPQLYPYWRSLVTETWSRNVPLDLNLRASNKVTFVPKDAKTDRAIAIEPHLNIYVQLGIGALLRRQLRLAGLDLDHQALSNRRAAGRAISSQLATIDLSSASDTIASEVVKLLLPVDWYALLSLARCEYSQLPGGEEVRLEKFSSMGNGFTFELETLIFLALARASGDRDAVAFGDDIILKQENAPVLIQTLKILGFKVNERKTFLAGTFFESCGADYWRGRNIRPFYLKGVYSDVTTAVIRVANKIRLYAHRRNLDFGCDVRFLRAWVYVISRDSSARRTGVPVGSGDDGLVRNLDEATPSRPRFGFAGYLATVWRGKPPVSMKTDSRGALLTALAWGSPSDTRLRENVRGFEGRKTITRQLVMSWPDLGPWF